LPPLRLGDELRLRCLTCSLVRRAPEPCVVRDIVADTATSGEGVMNKELPSGTVTFMVTDLEGSTRL
jgi:hypothetical protein